MSSVHVLDGVFLSQVIYIIISFSDTDHSEGPYDKTKKAH